MSSLNWESKFSSIVRETEANLAKVRQRLGASKSSSVYDSLSMYSSPKSNYSGNYGNTYSSPTSSYSSPEKTAYQSSQPMSYSSADKANYHTSLTTSGLQTNEPSPGLVALLDDKIEQQGRLIENLSRQIQSLEKDKDQMSNQLTKYEDKLRAMDQRLSEKGIDLQTERKIDMWKREVKTELYDIRTQLQSKRYNQDDDKVASVQRDFRDSKRQLEEENDALRREIESLKTRLLSHEVDIKSQLADTKDMGRKLDRLDKNVYNMSDSQRRQSREMSDTLQSNHSTQKQLTQIRTEMEKLLDGVSRLENKDSVGPVEMNGVDRIPPPTDFGSKKAGEFDSYALSLSDFDISSVSLGDYQNSDFSFTPKQLNAKDIEVSPLSEPDLTIDIYDLDLSGTQTISSVELESDVL
ncbi:uncharacterized protein LOC144436474 [Glandiceps talaboti]